MLIEADEIFNQMADQGFFTNESGMYFQAFLAQAMEAASAFTQNLMSKERFISLHWILAEAFQMGTSILL